MVETPIDRQREYGRRDGRHVILDTDAVLGLVQREDGDFRLSKSPMRRLLQYAQPPLFQVSVPHVVVLELVNHYREVWPAAQDRLRVALRKASTLLGRTLASDLSASELTSADAYETWLRNELTR